MRRLVISNLLGLVGAAAGGALGFGIFWWLWEQDYYGLMIPGALLGLGCSLLARHNSMVRGVLCGIAALGLALFSEWWLRPFDADTSLRYFLMHVKDLTPTTFLMAGIGALIAFWVGKDGGRAGSPRTSTRRDEASPKKVPPAAD
jgi:hypothetical protein